MIGTQYRTTPSIFRMVSVFPHPIRQFQCQQLWTSSKYVNMIKLIIFWSSIYAIGKKDMSNCEFYITDKKFSHEAIWSLKGKDSPVVSYYDGPGRSFICISYELYSLHDTYDVHRKYMLLAMHHINSISSNTFVPVLHSWLWQRP